jgi:prefoldin subunit 5
LKKDLDGKKSLKQLSEELKEKDEIIFDLRREGEDLSKQQLKLETVIKNLRSKEKENHATITKLK